MKNVNSRKNQEEKRYINKFTYYLTLGKKFKKYFGNLKILVYSETYYSERALCIIS